MVRRRMGRGRVVIFGSGDGEWGVGSVYIGFCGLVGVSEGFREIGSEKVTIWLLFCRVGSMVILRRVGG